MTEQNYFFVCNPVADTGRLKNNWVDFLDFVHQKLPEDRFEWSFTETPNHARELTSQAFEQGYHNIISVGGDGTMNQVCNEIIRNNYQVKIGTIPMGTSNDTHMNYFHPQSPEESLELILKGYSEKFAVAEVTGDFGDEPYYVIDHIDCGVASLAAQGALHGPKWLKGDFKYTFYAVKNILRFKRNPAEVVVDGEVQTGEYTLISASAGESMGGYRVWPENHHGYDDFAICIAEGQSRFGLLKLLLAAEKGNHIEHEGVQYIRGQELDIYLERMWPFQAEGEIFTEGSREVHIRYKPRALELITEKKSM